MRANRNRVNILRAAALSALVGAPLYADNEGDKGKGGAEDKKKADEPKKIELTEAELEQRIKSSTEAALKSEREKREKQDLEDKEKREREEAEKQGEFKTLAEKADEKRIQAEEKAAASERRAQIAEVNIQLRDHLATTHADYLSNAADIMLHVEKKLAADAKPEDMAKLIKDEAAAFVERTPRQKQQAGTPSGSVRGKAPANQQQTNEESKNGKREAAPRRSFATNF